MMDPHHVVQEPGVPYDTPEEQWTDAISGEVSSERYPIGPPSSEDAGGCYVDGEIETSAEFDDQSLKYTVGKHSHSHYSFCGVNIHNWNTFFTTEVLINAPAGSRFRYQLTADGNRETSEYDNPIAYEVSSNVFSKYDPLTAPMTQGGIHTSDNERLIGNDTFSRAITLNVNGSHGFGYSNVMMCPHIPWHTSSVESLVVELLVEPDCCPLKKDEYKWCTHYNQFNGGCAAGWYNNCFNYALNIRSFDFKNIPGTSKPFKCDELSQQAVAYGLEKLDDDDPAECEFGKCLVALYVQEPGCREYKYSSKQCLYVEHQDWHWVRQNQDGSWTQKSSYLPVTDVVDTPGPGHEIPFPWGLCPDHPYKFCSYYCVPCSDTSQASGGSSTTTRQMLADDSAVSVTMLVGSGAMPSWTIDDLEAIDELYSQLTGVARELEEGEYPDIETMAFPGFLVESPFTEAHPAMLWVNEGFVMEIGEDFFLIYDGTDDSLYDLLWDQAAERFGGYEE